MFADCIPDACGSGFIDFNAFGITGINPHGTQTFGHIMENKCASVFVRAD